MKIMLEKNRTINKSIISDYRINENIFVIFLYATLIVDCYRKINEIFLHIPINSVELFRNTIYIFVFMYILYHAVNNKTLYSILILSISFILTIIISFWITPEISILIPDTILIFFSRCLCGFYFGLYITNYKVIIKKMQQFSIIAVGYAFIIIIFAEKASSNYMPIAYNLLIPFLSVFFGAILQNKKFHYLMATILLWVIIGYGARGPLFCIIAASLILFVIKYKDISVFIKLISIVVTIMFILTISINYDSIVLKLLTMFPDSRTVALIYNGNLFNLAGRDLYFNSSLQMISDNPFRVRGVLSDRVFFSSLFYSDISGGNYAHNIILELCLHYGIIIATSILIYITITTLLACKCASNSYDKYLKIFFSIIFGYVVVSLMVSGSYVTNYLLWIYLGLIINLKRSYSNKERVNLYETKTFK